MNVLAEFLRGRLPYFILTLSITAALFFLPAAGALPSASARETRPSFPIDGSLALNVPLSSPSLILYMPIVGKYSPIVFQDDFSDSNSGWPNVEIGDWCNFKYKDGAYQIQSYRPVSYNTICSAKNYAVPSQPNGTFSVRVRRLSGTDRPVFMGMWFGADDDAIHYRWEMMAYPNKSENDCDGKKAGFSFAAIVDGKAKEYHFICSSNIGTEDKAWSTLKVIRDGANLAFFVNDKKQYESNSASYNLDKGYVLLAMTAMDESTDEDNPLTVEFDDLVISREAIFP